MTEPDTAPRVSRGRFVETGFYPRHGCEAPLPAFSDLGAGGFSIMDAIVQPPLVNNMLPSEPPGSCTASKPEDTTVSIPLRPEQPRFARSAASSALRTRRCAIASRPTDAPDLTGRSYACTGIPQLGDLTRRPRISCSSSSRRSPTRPCKGHHALHVGRLRRRQASGATRPNGITAQRRPRGGHARRWRQDDRYAQRYSRSRLAASPYAQSPSDAARRHQPPPHRHRRQQATPASDEPVITDRGRCAHRSCRCRPRPTAIAWTRPGFRLGLGLVYGEMQGLRGAPSGRLLGPRLASGCGSTRTGRSSRRSSTRPRVASGGLSGCGSPARSIRRGT